MKPKPPTENALLAAVREMISLAPPAPWMTLQEIMEALSIREGQAHRRIQALHRAGRVERQQAPRRGSGTGMTWYYKIKDGKP